jgi:hypothetical protein
MGRRLLLALGWLWPFLVATAGVAMIAAGQSLRSDGAMLGLLVAALLGSPAVVVTLAAQLPRGWPDPARVAVALALAVPVVGVELSLAANVLAAGANAAGLGWIE